ncbi:hypothetical protein [uncultured Eudoraea sp.]|uniref:DUF6973 domain-containing protein n=1 Tax=uncultured Eudoraea sp. TaxID=1035614 RepID=UPI002628E449|nr:hypothetical protein [uncultured Eudoraea sp.]
MSLKQLFHFGILFAKNPLLIAPTIKASKRTIAICDLRFGSLHHSHRKENAFRHALWNWQICEYCRNSVKNDQKTAKWAKYVTKMYENVTKNENVEAAMDLHNNAIGRKLFLDEKWTKSTEIEQILLKMMEKAIKIDKIEELINLKDQLVYISE